jgi:hypothetical protein
MLIKREKFTKTLKPDEKIALDINRAGTTMSLAVQPVPACGFIATVTPNQDVNAFAEDGESWLRAA